MLTRCDRIVALIDAALADQRCPSCQHHLCKPAGPGCENPGYWHGQVDPS